MTTGFQTNTEAITGFFTQNTQRTGGYKWNLKQNGVTGTIASNSNGEKLIDDFSKSDGDTDKDGIIADGAELKSFITFAETYDKDAVKEGSLETYLQDQFTVKFGFDDFQSALDGMFNNTTLTNANTFSDGDLDEEQKFIRLLLRECAMTDKDRGEEIKRLTDSTKPEEVATLARLNALAGSTEKVNINKQSIEALEKTKAEETVSSFFTTKESDKTFTPAENNIKQIAIDNEGNLINPPASSNTPPKTTGEQAQEDRQLIDRAQNYARSENPTGTGSVDTIAWLAGRMQTRLLEIRRRIDNPEVRAAVSAFTDQVKEVPNKMNTRRISLSHLLGINAKGEDLRALFDDSVQNKSGGQAKFRDILIDNIFENKKKEGAENTYDFLIGLLQKHYPAEYAKGIGEKEFIEKLPENASKEEIGKYLDGFKSVLGSTLTDNRKFIEKINEALGKEKLIKVQGGAENSIWGILQNSAKSEVDVSLAGGGSFASKFPANLSSYMIRTAKSAGVIVGKTTHINEYVTKSVDKENQPQVRDEVQKFAALDTGEGLKGALKKGTLETVKAQLLLDLNAQVSKNSGKNANELAPADKLEAQIIVGKLILIEQSLSVRGDLITNKGTGSYFNNNAVSSYNNPKVSSRVQGLLSEFKNQEEAYSDLLTKAADETLAPLQQALDGIFNFDVGYSPIRSYGYMKADLDISRALVSMTINNVITDEIAKKTAAENGARSAGDTSQSTDKSKEGQDAASILGMINSSIDKLVENSSKNQASMAKGGEEMILGLQKSLGDAVSVPKTA